MPFSSRNLLVGEILPRAMPVRSLIKHSTSVILRSFSQLESWSSLVLIETSGLMRADSWRVGTALPRPLPASLTKGLEDGEIIRVGSYLPFGVPLHPQGETRRTFDGEGFDQPVRRQRFDAKARRQTLNALPVNGVDGNLAGQAEAGEHAARLHPQQVARSILHLERLIGLLAVIEHAGDLMHLLQQGAAEGHVDLLKAATDAEHRDAGGDGLADQWQGGAIALGIVRRPGLAGRAAIMMGLDIRSE